MILWIWSKTNNHLAQVLYLENCGLQEKLDSLTERLDRESIVTVGQDRFVWSSSSYDHMIIWSSSYYIDELIFGRSLGAGSEDVDGLTLTSIRSTTSSASKVNLQKVKLKVKIESRKTKLKVKVKVTNSASKVMLHKVKVNSESMIESEDKCRKKLKLKSKVKAVIDVRVTSV